MPCLYADLTTHAVNNILPCTVGYENGRENDGVKLFSAAKYGSVKVFIVVQERRA